MQTIARANRVTSWKINAVEKKNGEIIDYYNVFRNMRRALRDYALGQEDEEEPPVREKSELFKLLENAIDQAMAFCGEREIDLSALLKTTDVFKNVGMFAEYANKLLAKDEWRKGFAVYENTISSLYQAAKPEILGQPIVRSVAAFEYLRGVLDAIVEQKDLDAVGQQVSELLDESLIVDKDSLPKPSRPEMRITQRGKIWDLSKIDIDKLKEDFQQAKYKNIEIADLRAFITHKLEQMLKQNATRIDFAMRLQGIVDAYNAGSTSADNYFEELVKFTRELQGEAERHIREGLTEDELELFDVLKKERMTNDETQRVRLAAKSLLRRLQENDPRVFVTDWFKDAQSRSQVRSAVETVLNKHLPESYDRDLFRKKVDNLFAMMVGYASQGTKWVV